MCKHKSGGMSKPSGAATHQGNLSSRAVDPCPSHNHPSEANRVSSAASQEGTIQGQMSSDTLFSAQSKMSELTLIPANLHGGCSTADDTYKTRLSCVPCDDTKNMGVQSFNSPIFPENAACNQDSSDDEDDVVTELSPMLLSKKFSVCYAQASLQTSNHRMESQYEGACRCETDNAFLCNYNKIGTYEMQGTYTLDRCIDSPNSRITDRNKCGTCAFRDSTSKREWPCTQLTLDDNVQPTYHLPLVCVHSHPHGTGDSSVDSSDSCMTGSYSCSSLNTDPVPGPSGLQRRNSVHWEIANNDSDKEEEFRGRSYSLTPTVNFAVFESESASEAEDNAEVFIPESSELQPKEDQSSQQADEQLQIPVSSFNKIFHISPSAAQLSIASSYGDSGASICKICHMTSKENDPLISPCRCSGTMQYIHCGCLMRWLEITSKRSRKPASCELCQYQYHWHKKFKVRHWQMPHISRQDKILHLLFFISIIVMIACATITILCFKHDKGTKVNSERNDITELTRSEIITLVCGVTFFLAFFVAMYVEVKSHTTVYKLLVKFIYLNQQWYIDEYEKKEAAPVAV